MGAERIPFVTGPREVWGFDGDRIEANSEEFVGALAALTNHIRKETQTPCCESRQWKFTGGPRRAPVAKLKERKTTAPNLFPRQEPRACFSTWQKSSTPTNTSLRELSLCGAEMVRAYGAWRCML